MKLVEALPMVVVDLEGALVRIGRGDVVDQLREASVERWTYDELADALYIYFGTSDQQGETVSLYDEVGINVELDNQKRVAWLEILGGRGIAEQLAEQAAKLPAR